MNVKKLITLLIATAVASLVIYRIKDIAQESRREIFNVARHAAEVGVPAEIMTAQRQRDILREPVAVKNGRIFVSGARAYKFKPGQKIANGTITSVSRSIDLDTGLFIARTTAATGNHFVEMEFDGIFIPLSAIHDSVVMISENGIATQRQIEIIAADAERAVVSGLRNGDTVILTKVDEGTKINPRN